MPCPGCDTGGIYPHVGACPKRPAGTDYSGLPLNETVKTEPRPIAVSDVWDPEHDRLLSIDLNARAYGWEIGRGTPMAEQIESSPDNPFINPDWRDNL